MIESGKLMRTGRIAELTDETAVLGVEVERDADRLAAMLAERKVSRYRPSAVPSRLASGGDTDGVHDTILDAVVALELPLVRLERRRRTLEELFRPGAGSATRDAR